jgi:hypothetical protein
LRGTERYSEEEVSSLLQASALGPEGVDLEVVSDDLQAAVAYLEKFIYGDGAMGEAASEEVGGSGLAEGEVKEEVMEGVVATADGDTVPDEGAENPAS